MPLTVDSASVRADHFRDDRLHRCLVLHGGITKFGPRC